MKNTIAIFGISSLFLAGLGTAQAGVSVSFGAGIHISPPSIHIGVAPVVSCAPAAPVCVPAPRVVYVPAPVVAYSAPVVFAPQVVHVRPPVAVVVPPYFGANVRYAYGRHHYHNHCR